MTTVRKLSKSVPRHLSMVLRSTCRNAHVVGLPHYAFVAFAVRLRSLSPSAPLGATPTATAHTRSSAPTASCSALLWWTASEMCSSRRRTSAAPIPASCPATALQSPHGTPPHRLNTKKGDGFPSPSGGQAATLPSRERRFREWTNPTLSRPPSPGDRRSERSGCVRPRPVPQHLRVA